MSKGNHVKSKKKGRRPLPANLKKKEVRFFISDEEIKQDGGKSALETAIKNLEK